MTSTMIERGRDQIRRAVDERVKAGKYEEALKLAEDSETLCDFAGINRLDEIVSIGFATETSKRRCRHCKMGASF